MATTLNPDWKNENTIIKLTEGIPEEYCTNEIRQELSELLERVNCIICYGVFWKPVQCQKCQNNLCGACIDKLQAANQNNCPFCSQEFKKEKTHPAINAILSRDEYGCQATIPYEQFEKHLNSCPYRSGQRFNVKQIEIVDFRIIKQSLAKEYIVYDIKITYNCNESQFIQKRYTDFALFHQQLYSHPELQGRIIPQLPQKFYNFFSIIGYSPSNKSEILERQICLENYLRILCNDPTFFDKKPVKDFLQIKYDKNVENIDENIQQNIESFANNMMGLNKLQDLSLSKIQEQFQAFWNHDNQLNSQNLEENEKLCLKNQPVINTLFHYLINSINQYNEVIQNLQDQLKEKQLRDEQHTYQSFMEQQQKDINLILKKEIDDLIDAKQKMNTIITKIAYFHLKLSGFLDVLNKLKAETQEYANCIQKKKNCKDEQKKQQLENKINSYEQSLQIQQTNLEVDSNILKEEIIEQIPNIINEFLQAQSKIYNQNNEMSQQAVNQQIQIIK